MKLQGEGLPSSADPLCPSVRARTAHGRLRLAPGIGLAGVLSWCASRAMRWLATSAAYRAYSTLSRESQHAGHVAE